MSIAEQEILLKLELPLGGQTYLGDRIDFKFWITDPSQKDPVRKEEFEYEILCQEVNPASSSSYIGTMQDLVLYSSDSSSLGWSDLKVENVEFKDVGEIYHSPDGKIHSPILAVEGHIRRDLGLAGTFVLKIRVRLKGIHITSNSSYFTLGFRDEFLGKSLGGPTQNIPERHFGRAIVLRGWALSLGLEIESVEAIVPFASSILVKHGLEFRELEKSLPDLEEVRTAGIEIVALFDAPLEQELVSFNVRVKFNSGEIKDYYWGATKLSTEIKSGFVLTKLEEEGRWVRVEGNLFSPMLHGIQFFLTSSRGIKELSPDYVKIGPAEQSSDCVDSSYYSSNGSSKISFLLPNDFLGSNPGSVTLLVRVGGRQVRVLGSHVKEKFSLIFNPQHQYLRGSIFSKLFRFLGARGVLPVKAIQPEVPLVKHHGEKQVFFISHNLSLTEGAPRVIYSVIKAMAGPFPVSLISPREGEAREELFGVVKSCYVIPEVDQVGLDFARFRAGNEKMQDLLDIESPKLVVVNGLDSFPLVCSCLDNKIRVVWIIHESIDPAHWYSHLPISIRHRFLFALRHSDKIVFVSERTRGLYLPYIGKEASRVIRNGIDAEAFNSEVRDVDVEGEKARLKIQPNEFVFLTVGTTTERKGQDRTIRELAILKQGNPDFKFKMFFVGAREIPFLWSMRQLVDKLGLEREVKFIPETEDVAKYYAVADCFIINSREESSPLVALEAYAAGVPLVSTTVFGLVDLIKDGDNALAFDGDSEGELAEILHRVSGDEELREKLRKGGAKFVRDEFTLERMLGEYRKLLSTQIVSPTSIGGLDNPFDISKSRI